MSALRRALSEYVDEVVGGPSSRTSALLARLREIQRRNGGYLAAAVCMLVALFAVTIGLIVFSVGGTAAIAVASLFALSAVGIVRLMLSVWREKVATEMLIELGGLDEGVLRQVAAKLLDRLR